MQMTFQAGDYIIRQGEKGEAFYVINQGEALHTLARARTSKHTCARTRTRTHTHPHPNLRVHTRARTGALHAQEEHGRRQRGADGSAAAAEGARVQAAALPLSGRRINH